MKILTAGTGIKVLYKKVPSKLVSCRYYIKCGSVDELLPEQEGLCHGLEHMLFQGTLLRDWQKATRDFRKAGAYSDAETGYGHTEYEICAPKEYFENAFEVLADQVYNSIIPEDRWEIEKGTIISEIEEFLDTPDDLLERLSMRDAFGTNYKDPIGNIENIQKAKVEHLRYFKDSFYKGRNIFISIAGDLTEKQVLNIIDRYDSWSASPCKSRKILDFKFNPDPFVAVKPGITQAYLSWISPMNRYNRVREKIALEIGMDLLYNWLYEDIVFKRGLCYGIASEEFSDIRGCECLIISAPCSNNKMGQMIDQVPKSLSVFFREQMTKEKIEEARRSYLRGVLETSEDINEITVWMAESYLDNRTKDPLNETLKEINKIKDHTIRGILIESLAADSKLCVMTGDNVESSFSF